MKKLIQRAFVVSVLVIMATPFLLAHREYNRVAEDENRYYANFPDLEKDGKWNSEYIEEFEEWINDNARFRSVFRKIKTGMLYHVFDVLDWEGVGIGTNQELFGMSSSAIDLVQGRNLLSKAQLEEYEYLLYELQQWLYTESVDFYYMTCIDKVTIMKEFYPKEIVQYDTEHVGGQIEGYIEKKARVNNIELQEVLKSEIENNIYYKYYDWQHWNDAGMYLGYQELMKEIQKEHPEISYLQLEDYTIKKDIVRKEMYGLQYPFDEEYIRYYIKEKNAEEKETELYEQLDFKEHTHYYENEKGQKRALIINDSFIRMDMKDSLAESFKETLSVDLENLRNIKWLVKVYEPDIIILECVEGNISSVLEMLKEI